MSTKRCVLAAIFVAASAFMSWASAENIYKCGNTYSQSPCPGAKLLSVDDSRDPAQKKLKDDITRRDAELANEMEKTRLAKEAALAAERAREANNKAKPKPAKETPAEPVMVYSRKPRLHKPHQPKGFIAVLPDAAGKPNKSATKPPDGAF